MKRVLTGRRFKKVGLTLVVIGLCFLLAQAALRWGS